MTRAGLSLEGRERGASHPDGEWSRLRAALAWHYGPERTVAIFARQDAETNEDLRRWRELGACA